MSEGRYVFVDFDDTLATSMATWALDTAIPRFVHDHHLSFDRQTLYRSMLNAQKEANETPNADILLTGLFKTMGWSQELKSTFLTAYMRDYEISLFDDTLPFLTKVKQSNYTLVLLSNNPKSVENATRLGIASYFYRLLTPAQLAGEPRKPSIDVWHGVMKHIPDADASKSLIVGDDPYSEASFADVTGLEGWIIDRANRYAGLYESDTVTIVRTLLDIPIP